MKRLAELYVKNGYEHKLLWRDEDYAITEIRDKDTKKVYCLEAFEIIKNKEKVIGNNTIEARESSPSNEDWGQKGYTAHTIIEAQLKIGRLRSNKKNK